MMGKLFGKLTMTMKIFCTTALILFSSIVVTGGFVHNQSRRMYSESLDKAIQLIMEKNSSAIMDYFRRADALGNTMNTQIRAFFPQIQYETDVIQNYRTYLSLKNETEAFCSAILGQDSAYCCYLLLHSGFPMSKLFRSPGSSLFYDNTMSGNESLFLYSDEELKEEEWFQNAQMSDGDSYWFTSPENKDMILSACSLGDVFMINGEVMDCRLGTLVISIDISRIIENFDNDIFADETGIFITDSDYRIIYSEDPSLLSDHFFSLTEEKESSPTITMGETSYRLWEQVMPNDMRLFILVPEQTFNSQIWVNLQTILLVFFIVLLAEILLTALFTRIITKPIRKLSTHMKNISAPAPIAHNYQARDEIGILYYTYNEMAEKNELLIQQIFDYSEHQKKLKYQMLQAQINPHFLYNTLDSVSCAALINGENQLSDVLSTLASLLRYNMNQPDHLVTLHEELEMVKDYITIQQFRCDNRIHIDYNISSEAAFTKLPKTILQPLVENSIFYGSTNAEGCWKILIHADIGPAPEMVSMKNSNMVSIRICNEHEDLENALDADVEQLNNYLHGNCELKRRSSGLGILNVQQRIHLAFGENYGIHYERMGENIAAVVTLPFFI